MYERGYSTPLESEKLGYNEIEPAKLSIYIFNILGICVMVAQWSLTPFVEVRTFYPQPSKLITYLINRSINLDRKVPELTLVEDVIRRKSYTRDKSPVTNS